MEDSRVVLNPSDGGRKRNNSSSTCSDESLETGNTLAKQARQEWAISDPCPVKMRNELAGIRRKTDELRGTLLVFGKIDRNGLQTYFVSASNLAETVWINLHLLREYLSHTNSNVTPWMTSCIQSAICGALAVRGGLLSYSESQTTMDNAANIQGYIKEVVGIITEIEVVVKDGTCTCNGLIHNM